MWRRVHITAVGESGETIAVMACNARSAREATRRFFKRHPNSKWATEGGDVHELTFEWEW
jgi:hypothetical protein